ncbi:MAG: GTPase HflX [Rickettsiales bacterium]|nr:GTPase HflX [Rickettsiales bacterium]|tara:strand:- start:1734 stop:2999 length:1266 start_codon:yes stop_codon:yes gene_type:complete
MNDVLTPSINAFVIGIDSYHHDSILSIEDSLNELKDLARTAGMSVIQIVSQKQKHPVRGTYLGKGKIEEIKASIASQSIQCVLVDDDLTPAQSKFLEATFNVKVLDRTGLILDIFAQRAQTYEAKLQVELAQLHYLLPRLTRLWTHLSRLGGGIGTRGPGETQLEVDKRQLSVRVSHIKTKLKKIKKDRDLRRSKRHQLPTIKGALVGYTNAGKSTLMNRLTQSSVLTENKLFATLDPISRKFKFKHSEQIILTDTVGFIQKLPTLLIKAFYSTLEEVTDADFLLHVVDVSHPCFDEFIQTSNHIISDLNASDKPILYIFNKWDRVKNPNMIKKKLSAFQPHICISTQYDSNLDVFETALEDLLAPLKKTLTFFIPYQRMDIINLFHQFGSVESVTYNEEVTIKVTINEILAEKIMACLYK